jgi:hypothetical protein
MSKILPFQMEIFAQIENSKCEKTQEILSDEMQGELRSWILKGNIDHLSREEV